jgi:hypothetical protein
MIQYKGFMFYESQRIIEKQIKHEISKACDLISAFEDKSLSVVDMNAAIDILIEDAPTELYLAILNRAKNILHRRECYAEKHKK